MGPCFVVPCLVQFYNHLDGEERESCLLYFTLIEAVAVNARCCFLTVPCVGIQCAIVAFPGYNQFVLDEPSQS